MCKGKADESERCSNVAFEDYFPAMVEKLGGEGFMNELDKGFRLLADGDKGVITFQSLKMKSALLGLHDIDEHLLRSMLKLGDLDGDGCLNLMEFCVLMFRLSPHLINPANLLFTHFYNC